MADADRRLSPELRLDPFESQAAALWSIDQPLPGMPSPRISRALCRHTATLPRRNAERGHCAQVGVSKAHHQEKVMRRLVPVPNRSASPLRPPSPRRLSRTRSVKRSPGSRTSDAEHHAGDDRVVRDVSTKNRERARKPHDHVTDPPLFCSVSALGDASSRVRDRLRDLVPGRRTGAASAHGRKRSVPLSDLLRPDGRTASAPAMSRSAPTPATGAASSPSASAIPGGSSTSLTVRSTSPCWRPRRSRRRYYGSSPAYSYFSGCSTGGTRLDGRATPPAGLRRRHRRRSGNNRSNLNLAFLWNYLKQPSARATNRSPSSQRRSSW